MLSLTGVHQDTLYGSPDSKLSTPTFVSTPASVHLFLYLLQPQWTPNSPGFNPPDTVIYKYRYMVVKILCKIKKNTIFLKVL